MIEIYAVDSLDRIGPLDRITSAKFTETDLGVGFWQVELPIPEQGALASYWTSLNFPAVEAYDPETGWIYGGYVTKMETIKSAGESRLVVSGKDYMGDLLARLAYPNPDQVLDFWVTNSYGQSQMLAAAQEMVNQNLFQSSDPRRFIFGSTLDTLIASPTDVPAFEVVGDPILDMIKRWLFNTDYTFRADLNRDTPDDPTIMYRGRERETSVRVFHADRVEAEKITVTDAAAEGTDIIVMGEESVQGNPPRWVTSDTSPISNWRYRPIEKYYNRPGVGLDSLFDEAAGLKREQLPRLSAQIEGLDINTYGLDVKLGDRIIVNLGSFWRNQIVTPTVTGAEILVSGNASDQTVKREVFLDSPRIGGPDTVYQTIAKLRRDMQRLEAQAHKL